MAQIITHQGKVAGTGPGSSANGIPVGLLVSPDVQQPNNRLWCVHCPDRLLTTGFHFGAPVPSVFSFHEVLP